MKISVFGLGYVGTVSAACLAELGHEVIGVDVQEHKIKALQSGECVLIEPELSDLLAAGAKAGRLTATADPAEAISQTEVSLVCVGTPSDASGAIDLSYVGEVCEQIGKCLSQSPGHHVVVIRSTTLPGTIQNLVIPALEKASGLTAGKDFGVCTNPEFLREGSAVADFRTPPMIVIGQTTEADGDRLAGVYEGIECETFRCSPDEAMMVKYACNAYHAAKIVFGNEIGSLCTLFGLDSHRVMDVFSQDTHLNISARYLKPGFAFGGSCLPKDVKALMSLAHDGHLPVPMLESLMASNKTLVERGVELILDLKPKRVGVLGLSFKDKTDDLRESPVIEVVERLIGKGVDIVIHDSDVRMSQLFGANLSEIERRLPHLATLLRDDLDEVIAHGEVVVVAKPSAAYKDLPGRLGAEQQVVDLVRLFAPGQIPATQYRNVTG
ncbi:MAG: nucleotide sugar dehydrogenase [Planctomycetota bacterium]|jgi:GDP-mannose 6-dehydrogenase